MKSGVFVIDAESELEQDPVITRERDRDADDVE